MRLRRLWKPFLEEISLYLSQSADSAKRLVNIGAPKDRVRVTGNLKYDVRESGANAMTKRVGLLLGRTRLIVAGSTLAGEEELLLAAWPAIHKTVPEAALLIAPRHPDRFDEVLGLIRGSGVPFFRCSELLTATEPVSAELMGGTILLLDTIGDLASMYGVAATAFLGGSVVPKGGHNPLEAAQFGVPVVIGPSYENFREVVERMQDSDGILVLETAGELEPALVGLMTNRERAAVIGERGRKVFEAQAGAAARTVQALMALLQERPVTHR
jgi:3-deoxy-D-manno-octulosonic-acid transferase